MLLIFVYIRARGRHLTVLSKLVGSKI